MIRTLEEMFKNGEISRRKFLALSAAAGASAMLPAGNQELDGMRAIERWWFDA
jgi:hypothetical protein